MIKRFRTLLWSSAVGLAALSTSAQAGISPVSVAIIPPAQFPPEDFSITGVRASVLWGSHRRVYGFDFGGVGNITLQNFVGVGVAGGFNMTHGQTTILGLQAAGLANINTNQTQVYGIQVAALVNSNTAESHVLGLQVALANLSAHTVITGVQAGLYNRAHEVYGFQIGLINVVDQLHGLQIGLVNFNRQGLFAFAPILNVGF